MIVVCARESPRSAIWWRANEISIGHLTREREVGDRWRDKTAPGPSWSLSTIASSPASLTTAVSEQILGLSRLC
jgi:hypothetical protein